MTEPTDAELWQFYMTLPGATPTSQPDPIEIMRAVLAKWGTPPAVAGEPVAYRHMHDDGWEYYDAPTGSDCPGCEPLYTTPQPTQPPAVAVPMTPEQRDALWESCKYDDGEEWTVDWEQIVDAVERHHRIGIKGGQHGAE